MKKMIFFNEYFELMSKKYPQKNKLKMEKL